VFGFEKCILKILKLKKFKFKKRNIKKKGTDKTPIRILEKKPKKIFSPSCYGPGRGPVRPGEWCALSTGPNSEGAQISEY
jgi:hypothetical protein